MFYINLLVATEELEKIFISELINGKLCKPICKLIAKRGKVLTMLLNA